MNKEEMKKEFSLALYKIIAQTMEEIADRDVFSAKDLVRKMKEVSDAAYRVIEQGK